MIWFEHDWVPNSEVFKFQQKNPLLIEDFDFTSCYPRIEEQHEIDNITTIIGK